MVSLKESRREVAIVCRLAALGYKGLSLDHDDDYASDC